ncbi:MAG: glycine cleavage system aminomethyltransferase GcvT [Gammaproteobacteria bacterium]
MQTTCLFEEHQKLGAKLTNFSGWNMPLHYGSQIEEHLKVRSDVGLFDVSHMHTLRIQGPDALDFLSYVLANNPGKLKNGRALYSCILNPEGGIIDDLIAYKISDEDYFIVVNAGNLEIDLAWFEKQARPWEVQIQKLQDHGILALQGPKARSALNQAWPEIESFVTQAKAFDCLWLPEAQGLIAMTGYTGEDGLELILKQEQILKLWQVLIKQGVQPCGLGARDSLRLEAGFNLYGQDMNTETTPIESNLIWTVAFNPGERNFIGRAALEKNLHKITLELKSLVLLDKGVCRNGQKVFAKGLEIGLLTSGGYSPCLKKGIGLARIPTGFEQVQVEIHGKKVAAKLYPSPLVKQGKAQI